MLLKRAVPFRDVVFLPIERQSEGAEGANRPAGEIPPVAQEGTQDVKVIWRGWRVLSRELDAEVTA